jgi:cobalt-zinc-cadmium efflux system membrane fusion protein
VGSHVGPEDNLFEIVDPAKLLVRADVDEIAARRVVPDAKALIHARGAKEGCPGKVRSKLEVIDPTKRTMGIMIELSAACANLASGGFADVSVTLAPSQGALSVVVPRAAVVDLDGTTVVFVESPSAERGTFEIRNVSLGFSDGESVVVEEGLREGERIAVVGAFLLKGERMKPGSGE